MPWWVWLVALVWVVLFRLRVRRGRLERGQGIAPGVTRSESRGGF